MRDIIETIAGDCYEGRIIDTSGVETWTISTDGGMYTIAQDQVTALFLDGRWVMR